MVACIWYCVDLYVIYLLATWIVNRLLEPIGRVWLGEMHWIVLRSWNAAPVRRRRVAAPKSGPHVAYYIAEPAYSVNHFIPYDGRISGLFLEFAKARTRPLPKLDRIVNINTRRAKLERKLRLYDVRINGLSSPSPAKWIVISTWNHVVLPAEIIPTMEPDTLFVSTTSNIHVLKEISIMT